MSEKGSSNAFDCLYTPEIVIVTIIISGILSIITLLISIISLYKIVQYNKTTQKYPKSIYYTQCVFYIICTIISICRIPDIIACNYFPAQSTFHGLTMFIMSFAYIYHWIAFISIFYFRLKHIFKGTPYEISKCYNCISMFIMVVLSFIFPLFILISPIMLGNYNDFGVVLAVLLWFISMMFSQTLAFTLVYKLYQLNKSSTASEHNNNIIQEDIISTMTKYTLLTLISMTATIIYISIVASHINKSYHSSIKYLVLLTSNQLDVFIDTICVSLTLTLYDKYYKILCIKCDTKCKQCCLLLTKNATTTETELFKQMSKDSTNIPNTKESIVSLTTNSTV